jgi:hypothetical protein
MSGNYAAVADIRGKKLKNRVVNVVAARTLSNEDGATISRTGNNNRSNNRTKKEDIK